VRPINYLLVLCLLLIFFSGGCGYYFPHVYDGPPTTIYIPNWKNRTSELGLDTEIYQSLTRWFQKSQSIILTRDKSEANLILAGEVVAIELPSVSWNADARSTEVKVKLHVRYILKDQQSDEIIWEVPQEYWTEDYPVGSGSASVLADNEKQALKQILSDMSERIYLGTLDKLRQKNIRAAR
jgi:hypothetical protein